jgi:hypothetical protein
LEKGNRKMNLQRLTSKYQNWRDHRKRLGEYDAEYAELGKRYSAATDNILGRVKVRSNCDAKALPVYEARLIDIIVPGLLEFAGLHDHYRKLLQSGLDIEESDRTLIDDLFPGLSVSARVTLLEATDPRILGVAAQTLYFHHQGERATNDEYPGFEMNGISDLGNMAGLYKNLFTDEVTRTLLEKLPDLQRKWYHDPFSEECNQTVKEILAKKQSTEIKALTQFAEIVKGERKVKKIRRRRMIK